MKNLKSVGAVLLLFLMLSFANTNEPKVGIKVGQKAPIFQVGDTIDGHFDLKAEKGKFVILNFWAGYDAQSRVSNVKIQSAIDKLEAHDNIRFVSVSFDMNENVYRESVRLDGLNESTHYYDKNGEKSQIFRDFRLQKGFGNYLINPKGVIIAKNFSPEKLTQLIRQ